jgi:predicted nuclease of restriction endonuclease-like (RecB) superfamily
MKAKELDEKFGAGEDVSEYLDMSKVCRYGGGDVSTVALSGVGYAELLQQIKTAVTESRLRVQRVVNRELIELYWKIGKEIVERQEREGWGKSVVEQLSRDLCDEFPGMQGFSARNLWDMRRLYEEYQNAPNLRQLVAVIPWGQNLLILNSVKDLTARAYYLRMTGECGWSRNVLLNQIKAKAYERHVLAPKQHNFAETLPEHLAEQADEAMKDVYMLDFLGISKPVLEREMERRMVNRIRDVILELGYGFTFIGNQYRVTLEEREYFIDLLFYHRKLQCLVAIELKSGNFKPEYAGKMNFYLNILDDLVREPEENSSIGIILCAGSKRIEVEYALRSINKPVGVAEYTLTHDLPKELAGKLPNASQIEAEILRELGADVEKESV